MNGGSRVQARVTKSSTAHRGPVRPRTLALVFLLAGYAAADAAEFPQGLVLHFGFDEAAGGGTITDKSGRGNAGRASGTKWILAGKQGGSLEFAATNSFIAVPGSASLNSSQQTFCVWLRTTRSDATPRTLLEKNAAHGYALTLTPTTAGGTARGRIHFRAAGSSCTSDSGIADGNWHHVAATADGALLKLYIDGALQKDTAKLAGPLPVNTNELTIGMNRSSPTPAEKGQSFEGTLDELMIFDRAISAEQVQAVMAAARPKFSQAEVTRRLAELKDLLDRGLILPEFYERKVRECQPTQ